MKIMLGKRLRPCLQRDDLTYKELWTTWDYDEWADILRTTLLRDFFYFYFSTNLYIFTFYDLRHNSLFIVLLLYFFFAPFYKIFIILLFIFFFTNLVFKSKTIFQIFFLYSNFIIRYRHSFFIFFGFFTSGIKYFGEKQVISVLTSDWDTLHEWWMQMITVKKKSFLFIYIK